MEANLGAFVNIYRYDPVEWERRRDELLGLDRLQHIELWLERVPITTRERSDLVQIFKNRSRLLIHGPHIDLSLVTEWDDLAVISVRKALEAVEIANELGAELVSFHSGNVPWHVGDTDSEVLERLNDRLSLLAEAADMPVAVESAEHFRHGTLRELGSLATLAALAEMDDKSRFALDFSPDLTEKEVSDSLNFAEAHGEAVADVHIHESLLVKQPDVVRALHKTLAATGYRNFLTYQAVDYDNIRDTWPRFVDAFS